MRIIDLRRGLTLSLLIAVALACSFQAWTRLQGYLGYAELERMKARWHNEGNVPHDRELHEGLKIGYRALERGADNPDFRFMLASLHAWRERTLRLWPNQAEAENEKIVENLKAALVRRPSWFEAWILLALVKFQLNELDNEFVTALEKSLETGKYETAVHHGLAIIGPGTWDRIEPEMKERIVETLQVALDNTHVYDFVIEQIVMSGNVDLFRKKLESDENLRKKMNKYLKKRKEAL